MPERRKGRRQLLLLAAIFFGPVILAWLLYNPESTTQPGESTAHGELITPVKLVPDENLNVPRDEQDSPYPGRWTFVHVGPGACGEPCQFALYETRQVRKALGKEDRRVQRIYFLTDDTPLTAALIEQHPGLLIFTPDDALTGKFIEAIGQYNARSIFLIDPLGNLMMRFDPDTSMKDMHKDLKKLLKISQIG
jgi:hypothetical protein